MSALAGTRASEHNSTGGRLDRCGRCTLLDFMDFHRRPGGEASQRPGEASYSRGDGSFPLRRTAGNTRAKIPFAKLRPAYLPTVRRIARDPREDSHRPPGSVREFASGRPTREASHVACEASHKILHLARAHARRVCARKRKNTQIHPNAYGEVMAKLRKTHGEVTGKVTGKSRKRSRGKSRKSHGKARKSHGKVTEKSRESHGKVTGKSPGSHGEVMGKSWKSHGRFTGKVTEKSRESYGEVMGKSRKSH